MKDWPAELPYSDFYFPIIMNDWMDWEDLKVLSKYIDDWIINDKPNIILDDVILIHEMIGVT